MIPYQQASEALSKRGENLGSTAKNLATMAFSAGGLGAGSKLLTKMIPYVTGALASPDAIKGLSKLDPRIASFIKQAMSKGKNEDEILGFIGDKVDEAIPEAKEAQRKSNLPYDISEKLDEFLKDWVTRGFDPWEVFQGAENGVVGQDVKKVLRFAQKEKINLADTLRGLYGVKKDEALPESQATLQPQQEQQQQAGGMDPGLAQILQQGQMLLQNFKGKNG